MLSAYYYLEQIMMHPCLTPLLMSNHRDISTYTLTQVGAVCCSSYSCAMGISVTMDAGLLPLLVLSTSYYAASCQNPWFNLWNMAIYPHCTLYIIIWHVPDFKVGLLVPLPCEDIFSSFFSSDALMIFWLPWIIINAIVLVVVAINFYVSFLRQWDAHWFLP